MKKRKLSISDGVLFVFVLLLIIPQTRKPIQVALNNLKMQFFSPSALEEEDQISLQPFSYQVTALDDATSSIEVGKGKVTFISYWATWCPPCIAEMPSIQKLYTDYGETINFVLLTNEDPEVVRSFISKKQYDLPVYIPKMKTPKALYDKSIPTTFVIDKTGKIIIKETGATDWNAKNLRTTLDNLIQD